MVVDERLPMVGSRDRKQIPLRVIVDADVSVANLL